MKNKGILVLFSIVITLFIVSLISDYNKKEEGFSFAVYGDTRDGHSYHQQIVGLMDSKNPDFIFNVGDLVNEGCIMEQWDTFLNIVKDVCKSKDGLTNCQNSQNYLDTVYYPVIGNHDRVNECPDSFFSIFPFLKNQRYYTFEHENAFFIILDSNLKNETAENTPQYNWLVEQLEMGKGYDYTFVFFHHPVRPCIGHFPDIEKYWEPLFEEYQVEAVFNGHDHNYARHEIDGVNYIVAGGGGAPLDSVPPDCGVKAVSAYSFVIIKINGNKIEYKVYDINNEIIDEF